MTESKKEKILRELGFTKEKYQIFHELVSDIIQQKCLECTAFMTSQLNYREKVLSTVKFALALLASMVMMIFIISIMYANRISEDSLWKVEGVIISGIIGIVAI